MRAGLHRLLGLFAAKSINRNLEAEDREVWGQTTEPTTPDDMNITAAGNVTLNYPQPPSGGQQQLGPSPKGGGGWLPKLLLAASMLGGGAGLGYIAYDWLHGQPTADTDTDTITEFGLAK